MSQNALLDSPQHPTGRRRAVPQHPSEQLDAFAALAGHTDAVESLLAHAERVAGVILAVQGHFTVGEVREQLGKLGLLANDGKERGLAALGSLGRRMGCIADGVTRQTGDTFKITHANRCSIWRLPTPDERAEQMARSQPKRRSPQQRSPR